MLVAQTIHSRSRAGRPFERVDCGTLQTGDLAAGLLFGWEPGAHSTARGRSIGPLERAGDGTLVLDDVDYLPLHVQQMLLHPLERRSPSIRRLSGDVEVPIRCRIIATTNKDLKALVAQGAFREDLYSRLSGAVIIVPGVGDRREDLRELAEQFIRAAEREYGVRSLRVDESFFSAVGARLWMDIREIENAVRYAVGVASGGTLDSTTLPERVAQTGGGGRSTETGRSSAQALPHEDGVAGSGLDGALRDVLQRARKEAVRRALEGSGGDKPAAARRLAITVQWLNAILRDEEP
jgi:DNA-binding NtrC family response regulator